MEKKYFGNQVTCFFVHTCAPYPNAILATPSLKSNFLHLNLNSLCNSFKKTSSCGIGRFSKTYWKENTKDIWHMRLAQKRTISPGTILLSRWQMLVGPAQSAYMTQTRAESFLCWIWTLHLETSPSAGETPVPWKLLLLWTHVLYVCCAPNCTRSAQRSSAVFCTVFLICDCSWADS